MLVSKLVCIVGVVSSNYNFTLWNIAHDSTFLLIISRIVFLKLTLVQHDCGSIVLNKGKLKIRAMILVILLLIWNIHTKQNVVRITFPATLIDSLLTQYSLCHAYAYRGVINCRFFYSTTKPTLHQEHYYCKSKEFTMSSKQITKTTKIKCFLRKKKKGIMIIVECMSNCLVLGRGVKATR